MKRIDLNVDIGEGFAYDEVLMRFASSVNVCDGHYAGHRELTEATYHRARAKGLRVGLHPGFPDRASMGRALPGNVRPSLLDHVPPLLEAFAWDYVKPHGALYNSLTEETPDAALVQAISAWGKPLMLLAGFDLGLPQVIREGFADRAYLPDGRLMPRTSPGAVLTEAQEVALQVLEIAPRVDSICLHGDGEHALEFAELVTKTLFEAGYTIEPC